MKRGLYRIHGSNGQPDDVRMEDDGIEVPLEESLYRTRGYLPRVDDLLWEEDYFSKKRSPDGNTRDSAAVEKTAREQARKAFLTRFAKR